MNISVFGSGGWGTALSVLLHDNGHKVTLWSFDPKEAEVLREKRENPLLKGVVLPDGIEVTSDLEKAAASAELAVSAVPSFAVEQTAVKLKGRLRPGCPVVSVSKGIERETCRRFTEILESVLGDSHPVAALSGPSHAEEVGRGIPTACVAASKDLSTAEMVQDVFMNEARFRVYTSTDVTGVELGGALKNIIALCAGICDGLGFGDNTIAMLMTRGLAEMAVLCEAMGGKKETLSGLAGVGDLIVTCTSRHSRNRRAGVLIGQGVPAQEAMKQVGMVVEGYYATAAAKTLREKTGVSMPISEEAYKVLYEGKDPHLVVSQLMSRSRRSEEEPESTWL